MDFNDVLATSSGKQPKRSVAVRLDDETYTQLADLAAKHDLRVPVVARHAIEFVLKSLG